MTCLHNHSACKSVVLAIAIPFTGRSFVQLRLRSSPSLFLVSTRPARLVFLFIFSRCHRSFGQVLLAHRARRIIFAVSDPRAAGALCGVIVALYGRLGKVSPRWQPVCRRLHRRCQLMAYALGQILMSMCLTACAKIVAGGRRRLLQRCRHIRYPFAFFFIAFWRSPRCLYGRAALDGNCASGLLLLGVLISIIFFLPTFTLY